LTSWSVGPDLLSLNHGTNRLLEVVWSGGTRKVHSVEKHFTLVELVAVHHNDGGLGSTWSSYEKGVVVRWLVSLLRSHHRELGNLGNDVLGSGRVSSWDKKLGECNSLGRQPRLSRPHSPLKAGLVDIVVIDSLVINLNLLRTDWW